MCDIHLGVLICLIAERSVLNFCIRFQRTTFFVFRLLNDANVLDLCSNARSRIVRKLSTFHLTQLNNRQTTQNALNIPAVRKHSGKIEALLTRLTMQ